MFGNLNFLLPSRNQQSYRPETVATSAPEKSLAQCVVDNQQQILNALQELKQDQVELGKSTQSILTHQHQDYMSHFWALNSSQSHFQNLQSRIFSDQRAMIQQLETLKNRVTQLQR